MFLKKAYVRFREDLPDNPNTYAAVLPSSGDCSSTSVAPAARGTSSVVSAL
jgi:hypothetical protein